MCIRDRVRVAVGILCLGHPRSHGIGHQEGGLGLQVEQVFAAAAGIEGVAGQRIDEYRGLRHAGAPEAQADQPTGGRAQQAHQDLSLIHI